ncbi:MmcQ/YjbR family DNA-binding protein [Nocardioides dongxiaopingii]|nr:MmcQ/YjbR family DNA-binding protein [Nocardioides sp. S-1144]
MTPVWSPSPRTARLRRCGRHHGPVPSRIADFLDLVHQLPEVVRTDHARYHRLQVSGHTFGYLWEPTRTVGLKQELSEQLALVAERPEVFEVQFTAGAFGWVVVHLDGVERDELAELTFEAWRLTAAAGLVADRSDRLPV